MSPPEPIARRDDKNPSYPQRVHAGERARWQSILKTWETKIAVAARSAPASSPKAARIIAQMAGARDQIADGVLRLPMETGDLYEEDSHKVHEAVAALERLFKSFEAL